MWNISGCAVQGRAHIKNNIPCQDKIFSLSDDEINIIALADGAGSAALSHYGAQTAAECICKNLYENFDSYYAEDDGIKIKKHLLEVIRSALGQTAENLGCEISSLASTLLAAAIKDDRFILLHIGDGIIGYLKDGCLKTASAPENGEYANTTFFTTSPNAIMTMKLIKGRLKNIDGFVLMSDGPAASLYDKKRKTFSPSLLHLMNISLFARPEKIRSDLESSFETVIKDTTTDDLSIIMLTKRSCGLESFLSLSDLRKCELLRIPSDTSKRLIRRYEDILLYLETASDPASLSAHIHLKEGYTKKYLNRLLGIGLIEKEGNKYKTII